MSATSCPSCGAPLEHSGAAAVVVCAYCRGYSLVTVRGLDFQGNQAPLADIPSVLTLGASGALGGRGFRAMGRVRYDYGEGLWDEWSLRFDDGTNAWLQEDEGELTLFEERQVGGRVDLSDVRIGGAVTMFGRSIFTSEIGEATLVGGEGEITSLLAPGQRFDYIDGSTDGLLAVAMSAADPASSVLFLGREVSPRDIV